MRITKKRPQGIPGAARGLYPSKTLRIPRGRRPSPRPFPAPQARPQKAEAKNSRSEGACNRAAWAGGFLCGRGRAGERSGPCYDAMEQDRNNRTHQVKIRTVCIRRIKNNVCENQEGCSRPQTVGSESEPQRGRLQPSRRAERDRLRKRRSSGVSALRLFYKKVGASDT